MIDEGYIKFNSRWTPGPIPSAAGLDELIAVRNHLFSLELIGIYPNGIGYGNVSLRAGTGSEFIISGTRTGGIAVLGREQFTLVTQTGANSVECTGPVEASSESMTHAMLYACDPDIGSVVHVHHLEMWKWMHGKAPLSDRKVGYGTPEMAHEVERLYRSTDLPRVRIMAMGGHEEGIIAFGTGPKAAGEVIANWFENWKSER